MDYIQISKINDFIFCPYSLYYHSIYESFSVRTYHASPQTKGKIKHEPVEEGRYSTAKRYLQGLEICSTYYGLVGKIDIYDKQKLSLIERKSRVEKIYDGYKYQLYAQYFAMIEMGYDIQSLTIHSLEDNKNHGVNIPAGVELQKFEKTLKNMRNFNMNTKVITNCAKCNQCIYRVLCVYAVAQ